MKYPPYSWLVLLLAGGACYFAARMNVTERPADFPDLRVPTADEKAEHERAMKVYEAASARNAHFSIVTLGCAALFLSQLFGSDYFEESSRAFFLSVIGLVIGAIAVLAGLVLLAIDLAFYLAA